MDKFSCQGKLQVEITAFGPFLDIAENPSSEVAVLISEKLRQWGENLPLDVSYASLEVSVEGVKSYLLDTRTRLLEAISQGESAAIFIHFGVAALHRNIKVELLGRNCADFSKRADVKQLQMPQTEIIKGDDPELTRQPFFDSRICSEWTKCLCSSEGAPSSTLKAAGTNDVGIDSVCHSQITEKWAEGVLTSVPCAHISVTEVKDTMCKAPCGEMNEEEHAVLSPEQAEKNGNYSVCMNVSHNAGTYICNFTLFSSICLTEELNRRLGYTPAIVADERRYLKNDSPVSLPPFVSLFIHVVARETLVPEKQAEIIWPFVEALVKTRLATVHEILHFDSNDYIISAE